MSPLSSWCTEQQGLTQDQLAARCGIMFLSRGRNSCGRQLKKGLLKGKNRLVKSECVGVCIRVCVPVCVFLWVCLCVYVCACFHAVLCVFPVFFIKAMESKQCCAKSRCFFNVLSKCLFALLINSPYEILWQRNCFPSGSHFWALRSLAIIVCVKLWFHVGL